MIKKRTNIHFAKCKA